MVESIIHNYDRKRLGYPCSLNGERGAASVADAMGTLPGRYQLSEARIYTHANSLADGADASSHGAASPVLYIPRHHLLLRFTTEEASRRRSMAAMQCLVPHSWNRGYVCNPGGPFHRFTISSWRYGNVSHKRHAPKAPILSWTVPHLKSMLFWQENENGPNRQNLGSRRQVHVQIIKPDKGVRRDPTCHHTNIIQTDPL